MHQLLQYKKHNASYRGFIIQTLPRNAVTPITRYCVKYDGCSFGLFDALAEATKYIDSLCSGK